jgi:hypothetical protein
MSLYYAPSLPIPLDVAEKLCPELEITIPDREKPDSVRIFNKKEDSYAWATTVKNNIVHFAVYALLSGNSPYNTVELIASRVGLKLYCDMDDNGSYIDHYGKAIEITRDLARMTKFRKLYFDPIIFYR